MIELDERLKTYDRMGFFGRWHLSGGTPQSALLGAGSSGSVYVVRAVDTNEVAALKIIPIDESNPRVAGAKSTGARQNRLRTLLDEVKTEIAIMDKLRGMNRIAYFLDSEIVARTDTELESWDVLIRMQKLIPLKTYLSHKGLEPGMDLYGVEALRIWRDMSEALLICENKGVIHADVKPQNILFSPDNDSYMLSDFGVSINSRRFDGQYAPAGTPPYMAPEMQNRQGGDNRVDMYSLAATIYKMLNFDKLPPLDWDEKGKYSCLRQPVPRIKGIPGEINDVLLRCLAVDPNRRYDRWSDVKEITNALYVKYINGFTAKEKKGKKWLIPAAAGGAALVVLGVVVALLLGRGRSSGRDAAEITPEPAAMEQIVEPTPEPTPEPTSEPTPEPTSEPIPVLTQETESGSDTAAREESIPAASQIGQAVAEPTPKATSEPTPAPTPLPTVAPTEVPKLALDIDEEQIAAGAGEITLHGNVAVEGELSAENIALSVGGNPVDPLWESSEDGYQFTATLDMDLVGEEQLEIRAYVQNNDGIMPVAVSLPVTEQAAEQIEQSYVPIELDEPERLNNSWISSGQVLRLTGRAQPGAVLDVANNGSLLGSFEVEWDGSFTVEILSTSLQEGVNSITAGYSHVGESSEQQVSLTVYYDASAPLVQGPNRIDQNTQTISVSVEDIDEACTAELIVDGISVQSQTVSGGTAEMTQVDTLGLTADSVIEMRVTDGAGNTTTAQIVFQRTLNPIRIVSMPQQLAAGQSADVVGMADINTLLRIRCGEGEYEAETDADGSFVWTAGEWMLQQGENTITVEYAQADGHPVAAEDAGQVSFQLLCDREPPELNVTPDQIVSRDEKLMVSVAGEEEYQLMLVVDGEQVWQSDVLSSSDTVEVGIPEDTVLDKYSNIAVMVVDAAGNVSTVPVSYVTVDPITIVNAGELAGSTWRLNADIGLQLQTELGAFVEVMVNGGSIYNGAAPEDPIPMGGYLIVGENRIQVSYTAENGFPEGALVGKDAELTVVCDDLVGAYAISSSADFGAVDPGGTLSLEDCWALCSAEDMTGGNYVFMRLVGENGSTRDCSFSREQDDGNMYESLAQSAKLDRAYADKAYRITGVSIPEDCSGGQYTLEIVFDTEFDPQDLIYRLGIVTVTAGDSEEEEDYVDEEANYAIGLDEPLQEGCRPDSVVLTGWVYCVEGQQAYFDRCVLMDHGREREVYPTVTLFRRDDVQEHVPQLSGGTVDEAGFVLRLDLTELNLTDGEYEMQLFASNEMNVGWPTVTTTLRIGQNEALVDEQLLQQRVDGWIIPEPEQTPEPAA